MQDSGSPQALNQARTYLEECLENHKHCAWAKMGSKSLPTRVLDVGSDTVAPRLHVSEGAAGNWVALSYCWGGASDFILTAETTSRFENGVPLDEFPATLRDAITVTRALGIKYIWIDALCILQDSLEDWQAEAPKMGQIYTNADVVIAATASDDVNAGMFKARKVPKSVQMPWKAPTPSSEGATRSSPTELYVRLHSQDDDTQELIERNKETRWGTRGWTMQEDALATRMLSFTKGLITWDCLDRNTTESGEDQPPSYVFSSSRDFISRYVTRLVSSLTTGLPLSETATDPEHAEYDPDVRRMWYQVVHLYSRRNLTKSTDRLPALAGLAAYFKQSLDDEYCAGLWRKDLIYGLTWDWNMFEFAAQGDPDFLSKVTFDWKASSVPENKRPKTTEGPSWSWIGLEVPVADWNHRYPSDLEEKQPPTRVLDVQMGHVSENEFGAVHGGTLVMEGSYASLEAKDLGSLPESATSLQRVMHRFLTDVSFDTHPELSIRHVPFPGQKFVGLHLLTQSFSAAVLLLESVGGSTVETDEKEPKYVRIGILQISKRKSTQTDEQEDDAHLEEYEAYEECAKGDMPVGRFTII